MEIQQAGVQNEWASCEQKKWGEMGRGGKKGIPPPTVPYFSHSLAVSFPASAFENERLVHRLKRLERLGKDDRSVT